MWIPRLLLAATLVRSAASLAQALPVVPPPSYGNTVYLFVDVQHLFTSDAAFQPDADVILGALKSGGPYARVGASSFILLDLPWTADLANPNLSSPTLVWFSDALNRAQARGLAVQVGTDAGISRQVGIYDAARREDRRNAQWYMDGKISRGAIPSTPMTYDEIWMTPSRYARKLRRHLETKVRAFARMLIELRRQYPDTLVSASGDAEMELNSGGLDTSVSFENQMIADYSPFAIAEFRDWIRNAGLYGQGQPYAGQGLAGGGARYGGTDGLTNLTADFGTGFTSWSLRYFDWNVMSDPVDGDPKAIPDTTYEVIPGWTPLPSSPPDFVTGGFDAPRSAAAPSSVLAWNYWQLWLQFRETMVANYQKDFAKWVTTTADANGNTFEAQRWYSHQIAADYLYGTCPGCMTPPPDVRLRTSASPAWTANVAPSGSIGLTALDKYNGVNPITHLPQYQRTASPSLLNALQGVPNWGFVEWSPSWGVPNPDIPGIAANARLAYDAGAHILNYVPWVQFVDNAPATPQALDKFLLGVKNRPRDAATVAYAPTQVSGLSGQWIPGTISLSWSDLVFPGVAGFRYVDWAPFIFFEVWRGASRTFGTADGVRLASTRNSSWAGIVPDASRPFYRVRAVAIDLAGAAVYGAFSDAVWPPPPGGTTFFVMTPCRQVDTRGPDLLGSPIAALGTQIVTLTGGPCAIPATARAVSANVTVTQTTATGSLAIVPGDAAGPTTTSNVSFGLNQSRANNAVLFLAGDGSGTVRLENGSAGTIHVILDVNGYFK